MTMAILNFEFSILNSLRPSHGTAIAGGLAMDYRRFPGWGWKIENSKLSIENCDEKAPC